MARASTTAADTGRNAQQEPPGPLSDESLRLERSELLLGISRKLAAVDSLDDILASLVEMTSAALQADRSSLFLNDAHTGELFSIVAQGTARRRIRILNTSGIAGHVFQTGTGLIVHDVTKNKHFNKEVDKSTGYKTKNILCAPIRTVRGELLGVAQVLNKKAGKFSQGDLELLEAITMQAAIALQSAQLNEKMEQSRLKELEFMKVVADVTSEIDLGVLLRKVMAEATKMLQAERSTLFLNDEKTSELWSLVGEGIEAIQIRFPNHLGIAGAVYTSGQSVNIPFAYADLRFNPAFDKKTGFFTRSILCTPVTNKQGRVIGVTQVLNKRGGPFSEADESRLKAFTAQISIALENAKLFSDVQRMKNYNESMLQSNEQRRADPGRRRQDRNLQCGGSADSGPTPRRGHRPGRLPVLRRPRTSGWLRTCGRWKSPSPQAAVMDAELDFRGR